MQSLEIESTNINHPNAHEGETKGNLKQVKASKLESDEDSGSEQPPPFKLTISDYEEIAQRMESSLKQLQMVRDATSVSENLEPLREKIRQNCQAMTLRVKIVKKHGQHESLSNDKIITDIYRAELLDIQHKCFLLLKHAKSKKLDFEEEASGKGKSFLVDRIGLTINAKGEVLLVSSTLTVFRVESEEDNSDTFSVDSLELS
jgi:hypothetical protein